MEHNEKIGESQGWKKRLSAWQDKAKTAWGTIREKIPPGLRQFFLFQTGLEPEAPGWKHLLFWLWNSLPYLAATAGLGVVSLWFAASEYGQPMFDSYFDLPALVWLNLGPVLLLGLLLYAALGRQWPAFLLNGALVLAGSLINWFKLTLRNDPFLAADVSLVREAQNMAGKYQIVLTADMWRALAALAAVTLLLALGMRARPCPRARLAVFGAALTALLPLRQLWSDGDFYLYDPATDNGELITPWASAQVYVSKGFVYPFLHSASQTADRAPTGYDKQRAQEILAQYEDADIPEDKKVNVIGIMLEAYNDFSRFPQVKLNVDVYEEYHKLEQEGVSGNLITNIFAGGTIDTERCFLTGFSQLQDFRQDTNAYPWYFRDQGYRAEGSHPCFQWFYNRENVNRYLGFEDYYFVENYYGELTGGDIAMDEVLFPEIIDLYEQNKKTGKPYFSFNVSYQGHGPYDSQKYWWSYKGDFIHNENGRLSPEEQCILENYLGSLWNTNRHLKEFFDYFRQEEEPVVIVLFGDHNPWLGDDNSVYKALGIDLDPAGKKGFFNYYSTRYLIWANDAAKEALGRDFSGKGPDIAPSFLMNQLFAECGWQGPAYLQFTNQIMEAIQALHTSGLYVIDGQVTDLLTPEQMDIAGDYRTVEYYQKKNFQRRD